MYESRLVISQTSICKARSLDPDSQDVSQPHVMHLRESESLTQVWTTGDRIPGLFADLA